MRKPVCALLISCALFGVLSPCARATPLAPPPAVIGHWAKNEIITAYEMGLIDEWPTVPDAPVLRREAARLLADGRGLTPADGDLPLTDVAPTDPDRPWFVALYNEGIFRGDDRSRLRPDAPLTRAEFAAILARAAAGLLAEQREAKSFPDLQGHWAENEVATAYRLGLVNGSENAFEPGRNVALAEVLAMVVRMINGAPAPGVKLAPEDELTGLAVLDLELWAKAYSQTPLPDWTAVCANRIGVALYIMKESAALEDEYRRQGHTGTAIVKSSAARVVSVKPLHAIVTLESTGISVWDGSSTDIVDVSDVYLRRFKGRWMIYKTLGK